MAKRIPCDQTLYRRALGESFDRLPPVLRTFHDEPFGGRAQGTLCITRGQGRLRYLAALLMRLPPPGQQVPVRLQVRTDGAAEHWTRDFGTLRLVTKQWLHNGLLIETAGPLRFGFRVAAEAQILRFAFARCWLLGLPLPRVLSPRVEAEAHAQEDGWWIRVAISVPILGLLTQYEGKVVPQ